MLDVTLVLRIGLGCKQENTVLLQLQNYTSNLVVSRSKADHWEWFCSYANRITGFGRKTWRFFS